MALMLQQSRGLSLKMPPTSLVSG
ncbi:hypothetical protein A2U01_0101906, partial [Trifolium medium]|nr:hypothetical protein [Trifolium medium]